MELRERLQSSLGSAYTFERELGGGGMSRVFLAEEGRLGRKVVVKVLSPDLAADISSERFEREIKLAASLQQANIVPVLTAGDAGGVPYYTMPYAEGESLRALLATRGALSISETVGILRDVAHALSYAHARGVVHRDIKPDNVLLSQGTAVVTDFGIAKAISAARTGTGNPTLTQAGAPIGTPAYMAPEQVAGEPIDHRADIYAFGCLAYELLTGHPPFGGQTVQRVLGAHIAEAPRPVRELRPETPAVLASLVMRCLEKDPDSRPASADEMARALEAVATPTTVDGVRDLPRVAANSRWRITVGLLGLMAIVVAAVVLQLRAARAPSIQAVAVIPFANHSSSTDDQYAADGITDEVIGALGRIPGLRVASRSSVYALRGAGLDAPTMAARLRAGALIEGSVQRVDSQIRVSVQLIDGRKDGVLWSTSLQRDKRGLFTLQDELVRAIAVELRGRLAGRSQAVIRRGTENVEAYDFYLKGRHLWEQRDRGPGVLRQAADNFETAIRIDSTYSRAWAGLADVYSMLPAFGETPPAEAFPKARSAARRAIELDSTLAEAHTSMGIVSVFYDWDWATANREFARAIALDSSDARTHLFRTWYYVPIGDYENALRSILTAQRLDPTSQIINTRLGTLLMFMRRYDDAVNALRAAIELDSTNVGAKSDLMRVLAARRRGTEAIAGLPIPFDLQAGYRGGATVALAYAAAGRPAEARDALDRLKALAQRRYITPEAIATAALAVGDTAQALTFLERGYRERAFYMVFAGGEPFYEPVHNSPRFQRILSDMHVVQYGTAVAKP